MIFLNLIVLEFYRSGFSLKLFADSFRKLIRSSKEILYFDKFNEFEFKTIKVLERFDHQIDISTSYCLLCNPPA